VVNFLLLIGLLILYSSLSPGSEFSDWAWVITGLVFIGCNVGLMVWACKTPNRQQLRRLGMIASRGFQACIGFVLGMLVVGLPLGVVSEALGHAVDTSLALVIGGVSGACYVACLDIKWNDGDIDGFDVFTILFPRRVIERWKFRDNSP